MLVGNYILICFVIMCCTYR